MPKIIDGVQRVKPTEKKVLLSEDKSKDIPKPLDLPKPPVKTKKKKSPIKKFFRSNYGVATCAAVVLAVAITLIVIFFPKPTEVDEAYFVTDDTKSVLNLESDNPNSTRQTHIVYEYDGDNVSAIKTYFEYPDEAAAAASIESLKKQPEFEKSKVELDGKYIVVSANPDSFKGLTVDDVKQQVKAIEDFKRRQKAEKEKTEAPAEPAPEE